MSMEIPFLLTYRQSRRWRDIMHTKTMEGLVGASTNMNLLNTPFRVYKEARRKGDTGTMERAMGYVNECSDKAQEYRVKAEEGMEEDAKEAREKAQTEREANIQRRRQERQELEKQMEESKNKNTDTAKIGGDDKAMKKETAGPDDVAQKGNTDGEIMAEASKRESVIYTKTGEAGQSRQSAANISVLV